MSDNIFSMIMNQAKNSTDEFMDKKKNKIEKITSADKVVEISLDETLMIDSIVVSRAKFSQYPINKIRMTIVNLVKEYIIRVDDYYSEYTKDLHQSFTDLEVIGSDDPGKTLHESRIIIRGIIKMLEGTSLSGTGHFKNITIRTNGLLENMNIFVSSSDVLHDVEYFKSELKQVLTDLYLNYLMLLNKQQKIIWENS